MRQMRDYFSWLTACRQHRSKQQQGEREQQTSYQRRWIVRHTHRRQSLPSASCRYALPTKICECQPIKVIMDNNYLRIVLETSAFPSPWKLKGNNSPRGGVSGFLVWMCNKINSFAPRSLQHALPSLGTFSLVPKPFLPAVFDLFQHGHIQWWRPWRSVV